MLKKTVISFVILVVAAIAAFMLLLRGCLSRYDERTALTPALYFKKDNKAVVFTIIQYGKASSYKSGPGGTYKSMNTNYYLQANDAETGAVIATKKIKHNSDIKFHPVTTMGSGNGKAWIFMNELLAYDPFTLEKFADKLIIETKNPQLKGKMPDQKNYYDYHSVTNEILITATDGIQYALSTATLLAIAVDDGGVSQSPLAMKIKTLKKEQAQLDKEYKEYAERFRSYNKLYAAQKISYSAYLDSSRNFNRMQDTISSRKRMLSAEIDDLDDLLDTDKDRHHMITSMQNGTKNYSALCTAVDTFNGKWFGLLSNSDLEKPETYFRYRSVYTETARNKFYQAAASIKDSSKKKIQLLIASPEKINDAVYLQGGFLLNKATALPIHLTNEAGFIICSKEKVGNEGEIILTRINLAGKALWAYHTTLTGFADWIYTDNKLIILGKDNKKISSGDANLLLIINLQNGQVVTYDYFTDKMRKGA